VAGGTLAIDVGVIARAPSVRLSGGMVQASSVLVNGTSGIARLDVQGGGFSNRPVLSVSGSGVVQLPASAAVDLQVGGLTVDQATGGRLDVGGSRITVAAGGIAQAALVADLRSGLGSGVWDGTSGITSSAAAAAIAGGTARTIGWIDNGGSSFSIAFAAPGDTNIDGVLDILDAANVLAGSLYDTGAATTWSQGDFNYDGVMDILDVADFIGTGLFDGGDYLPGSAAAGIAAVPEPGGLALIAAGAVAWWIRRRTARWS
jgi:hypothetical protein